MDEEAGKKGTTQVKLRKKGKGRQSTDLGRGFKCLHQVPTRQQVEASVGTWKSESTTKILDCKGEIVESRI